jgi:hypothetical protein
MQAMRMEDGRWLNNAMGPTQRRKGAKTRAVSKGKQCRSADILVRQTMCNEEADKNVRAPSVASLLPGVFVLTAVFGFIFMSNSN